MQRGDLGSGDLGRCNSLGENPINFHRHINSRSHERSPWPVSARAVCVALSSPLDDLMEAPDRVLAASLLFSVRARKGSKICSGSRNWHRQQSPDCPSSQSRSPSSLLRRAVCLPSPVQYLRPSPFRSLGCSPHPLVRFYLDLGRFRRGNALSDAARIFGFVKNLAYHACLLVQLLVCINRFSAVFFSMTHAVTS